MITSFIDGRVRLRAPALKDSTQVAEIQSMLGGYEGIARIESNLRTGSLLIEYDPGVISRDMLTFAASALETQLASTTPEAVSGDKQYHGEAFLLIAALAVCLVGAATGAKSWHVLSGGVFTLLTVNHVFMRRQTLSSEPA